MPPKFMNMMNPSGEQMDQQNFMYGNQLNNKMNMMPHNQSSYKGEQMRNVDYFMNSIINNIANNNMNNIPPSNIQAIQKMIDSQNEPGSAGLPASLPLNTNTNNPELNNVNNIANNFGKIVEAINIFNSKHINHNNNVVSAVNNLTGVLSNCYNEQEKQGDNNQDGDEKKDDCKLIFFL
jgi:hypothetical protein